MNAVIGAVLPLAVTAAISPLPIIAVILMLLAPRAGGASVGFLVGWIAGVVAVSVLFTVLARVLGLSGGGHGGVASGVVKLVLGAGLLLAGVRQWRSRPRDGAEPAPPKWMGAIDTMTAPKAAGLAFLLSAVNPKNLAVLLAAGVAIGSADLGVGQTVVVVAIVTVLASCTVAAPVVLYEVARDRARVVLAHVREWLVAHNAAVMTVVLLLIGVVLIGKGIATL